MTAQTASELDAADPLAACRKRFALPEGVVYLDGNSLGALPRGVAKRVQTAVANEWGQGLIGSWNSHDWINLPRRVGEKIAPLIGAAPGQVLCCDSISVNLFKLLATALALRPGRRVILTEGDNFPTDIYMTSGLQALLGSDRCATRQVPAEQLANAIDDDVAVLMLTQVNFRTGFRHDMRSLTRAAHERGALVLWDLAHSAGVMPIALDDCGADMAVGCGYKFFNGGPGAPAFLYLAREHQDCVAQPLSGWLGHAQPFAFDPVYTPGAGVQQYQAGTPGIIGMQALDAALDLYAGIDLAQVRQKSEDLTTFFIAAVAADKSLAALQLITPRDPARRGSHVSLAHAQAYAIAQCLIAEQVIVDFRAPNIVRFGFAPMYNSFADAQRAVEMLAVIMRDRRYMNARFQERAQVT